MVCCLFVRVLMTGEVMALGRLRCWYWGGFVEDLPPPSPLLPLFAGGWWRWCVCVGGGGSGGSECGGGGLRRGRRGQDGSREGRRLVGCVGTGRGRSEGVCVGMLELVFRFW